MSSLLSILTVFLFKNTWICFSEIFLFFIDPICCAKNHDVFSFAQKYWRVKGVCFRQAENCIQCPSKKFFEHPKKLFTHFFTEFWEHFSYYGIRVIPVFYMYYEVSKVGKVIVNFVPCCNELSTEIVPSCASIKLFTIAIPKPVPSDFCSVVVPR